MRTEPLVILIVGIFTVEVIGQPGEFTYTGSMNQARIFHTTTLLKDGRVLVTGGFIDGSVFSSSEVYSPERGEFVLIGDMNSPRYAHRAVRLLNGKVLIVGGVPSWLPPTPAEIFDPTTTKFEETDRPRFRGSGHTLTLLKDGKVLVAGGAIEGTVRVRTAELYDPNIGTFFTTGDMAQWRSGHTAVLLKNNRVLLSGGIDTLGHPLGTVELYDPNTGIFSLTGNMLHKRIYHTATLLPDGRVLIGGGCNETEGILKNTELYDPNTEAFSPGPDMTAPRFWHTATGPTKCGQIMFAGGVGDTLSEKYLSSAEVYDSDHEVFSPTGTMNIPRVLHSAVMLLDGRVLVTGGMPNTSEVLNTAELYEFKVGVQEKPRNKFQTRGVELNIYPNPFKAVTSIKWQVIGREPVNLEVYDAAGKLVRTLIRTKGLEHRAKSIVWDGRDDKGKPLPSGIYFCELRAGDYRVTKKIVLMR